jgi:protein TonB
MTYARTKADQRKAAALVVALHVAMGAALISGLGVDIARHAADRLHSYSVVEVPPPPPKSPPLTTRTRAGAEQEPARANVRSAPLPQVAPTPRLAVPSPTPAAVADARETGLDRTAGAADLAGPGTGAGGSGDWPGGGGLGGSGAGSGTQVASPARMLRGMRSRLNGSYLDGFMVDSGRAVLSLLIDTRGRVAGCTVTEGTGNAVLDDELCMRMASRSRWAPALDTAGRPIPVNLRYTATWSRS